MIETPHVVRTEPQLIAAIRLTIPRSEIQTVMGPSISEVLAVVAAQGLTPAGPIFSHHFRITPDVFDFEVGVPVSSPVLATSRVHPGQRPARTVVRTVFHGGYEGLGPAWGELDAWMAAHGHTPAADLWECYVAGPESSANPGEWRTELNRPVAGA